MNKSRPRILVIDDTPANLQTLGASLQEHFDLQIATSGPIGLALAAKVPPDLILLDVMMPDMDGYEVCRRLKATPRLKSIPVIFLTALSESESESAGLALGAVDYITKPMNVEVARTRIGNLVERDGLRKEVEAQRDQLLRAASLLDQARLRELEIGSNIQRTLLQGPVPETIGGAAFASFSEPSQGLDGDFFDIRRLRTGSFEILVGDVMGKGVPAALIGAAIKTTYNQVLADLQAQRAGTNTLPSPAEIVNRLHLALTPQLLDLSSFATLALYRCDLAAGTLIFVNAGHTHGLLRRSETGQVEHLIGDNVPVGVMAGEIYVESTVPIGTGDSLLVFSDGISEARSVGGEEFGVDRLSDLLAVGCQSFLKPVALLNSIRQAVKSFTSDANPTDDQTALIVSLLDK